MLGHSTGASVGALAALLLGAQLWIGAAAGALVAGLALLWLARPALAAADDASPRLILLGAMLASVFGAVATLMLALVPDQRLRGAIFWMVGDLSGADASLWNLGRRRPCSSRWLWARGRSVDRLMLGADAAWLLGEPVRRLRLELLVFASLAVGLAVATSGAIGFVGLVVAQGWRLAGVLRTRELAVLSTLSGAALLMAADLLARLVVAPLELPVGAVMALIGAPCFIWFLARERQVSGAPVARDARADACAPPAARWSTRLDWRVHAGERWCVIGRNGAGKSLVLRALAGLGVPDATGEVLWQGRPQQDWPVGAAAALRALMPQQAQDRFALTVERTLALSQVVAPDDVGARRRTDVCVGHRRAGRAPRRPAVRRRAPARRARAVRDAGRRADAARRAGVVPGSRAPAARRPLAGRRGRRRTRLDRQRARPELDRPRRDARAGAVRRRRAGRPGRSTRSSARRCWSAPTAARGAASRAPGSPPSRLPKFPSNLARPGGCPMSLPWRRDGSQPALRAISSGAFQAFRRRWAHSNSAAPARTNIQLSGSGMDGSGTAKPGNPDPSPARWGTFILPLPNPAMFEAS